MRKVTISSVTAPPVIARSGQGVAEIVSQNIELWRGEIEKVLPDQPDIIILPELCDRPKVGSITEEELSEMFASGNDSFLKFILDIAKKNRTHILYPSYRIDERGEKWNSCYLVDRAGQILGIYDKNHLVEFEHSLRGINYSDEICILDLDFGRVGFAICFDLNFTELLDKYRHKGIELLLFPSEYHGGIMQNYWAYQLRAYFASSIRPPAPSTLISPIGEVVATSTNYFNHYSEQINLDYFLVHLDENWVRLEDMKRKYGAGVKVIDPGKLGSVLVTSETESLTARDLIDEFQFLLLDEYLERSRNHRTTNLKP
jgi:hypothetical protein